MNRITAALGAGLALAGTGLAGCAHNDVLVFGTSTTIGANLETSGGQGAPSIVIGFERQEAVWMPLIANATRSQVVACHATDGRTCPAPTSTPAPAQAMYQSIVTENGRVVRTDSYSVFASLGAKFNGDVAANGAEAGAGLAQFFATGNAALNISSNEALMTALKVESPSGADAQAKAVTAAAFSNDPAAFEAYLASNLTPEARQTAITTGENAASTTLTEITAIEFCARQGGGWRLPAIAAQVDAAHKADADQIATKAWPEARTALVADTGLRTAFLDAGHTAFQCQKG